MRSSLRPPDRGQAWFVVLPDCDAARGVAAALGPHAPQALPHSSGRPWLIGCWAADELVAARVGETQVAVIGCCPVTAAALSALADRVRTVADLDRLGAGLVGSFHLVAAVGGQVRVQGSVPGLRQLPLMYADVGEGGVGADGPHIVIRDHASTTCVARRLVERGSRLHLGGMGGDQVLQASAAYLHTTAVTHPRIAASHLRGWRAVGGWPLRATLCGLADHRSYQAWLTATVDDLTAPSPARGMPDLGWGPALRLPPWATPPAADAARTLLHEAAAGAQALAPTRGQHATLEQLRGVGYLTHNIAGIMGRAGLPLAAPFLDDRMVEACLVVRLHERSTPWRFKSLIVESMRDLVPATVMDRTTKGVFSAEGHTGLRNARPHLAGLLDDLALARLGRRRRVAQGLPRALPLQLGSGSTGPDSGVRSMVAHPDPSTACHRDRSVPMTLQLRADVSTADTDDGLVLLDERAGRYWQLNSTGALVLRLLLDGVTPHQVAQTLADRHPVSAERAAADVAALLAHLRTAGLVTDHRRGRP